MARLARCPEKVKVGFGIRPATFTPRIRRTGYGYMCFRVILSHENWSQLTELLWNQEVQFRNQIEYHLELEGMDHE